jgi:hypothetical protein
MTLFPPLTGLPTSPNAATRLAIAATRAVALRPRIDVLPYVIADCCALVPGDRCAQSHRCLHVDGVPSFQVLFGLARVMLGQARLDPAFMLGLRVEQLLALGWVVFGVAYGLRHGLWSSVRETPRVEDRAVEPALAKDGRLAA